MKREGSFKISEMGCVHPFWIVLIRWYRRLGWLLIVFQQVRAVILRQAIQSGGSVHVINLLTSGLFTVNAMWSY